MADWVAIKTDYFNGMSLRDLASKYKLAYTTIANRSRKEGWVEERNQNNIKTTSKMIEKASKEKVDNYEKFLKLSTKVLDEVLKQTEEQGLPDTKKDLKALTGAIRDLKEILDVKSQADQDEQAARIEKLRAETRKDDEEAKSVSVVFKGVDEQWLK